MEAQRSEVTYTRSHGNDSGKGPDFRSLDSPGSNLGSSCPHPPQSQDEIQGEH